MPPIPVPILGTQGFATDSLTKFSTLMAHLFESDYNQTQLYPNKVTSISRIMEQSGTDMSLVQTNLRRSLSDYFTAYYPGSNSSAAVNVTIIDNDDTKSTVTAKIDIRIYDEGQAILGSWQFTSNNNVITKVIQQVNYGD